MGVVNITPGHENVRDQNRDDHRGRKCPGCCSELVAVAGRLRCMGTFGPCEIGDLEEQRAEQAEQRRVAV